jgi:hypothetical protein
MYTNPSLVSGYESQPGLVPQPKDMGQVQAKDLVDMYRTAALSGGKMDRNAIEAMRANLASNGYRTTQETMLMLLDLAQKPGADAEVAREIYMALSPGGSVDPHQLFGSGAAADPENKGMIWDAGNWRAKTPAELEAERLKLESDLKRSQQIQQNWKYKFR